MGYQRRVHGDTQTSDSEVVTSKYNSRCSSLCSSSLLPSPLRPAMATVDTVATATAVDMVATARGATDTTRGRLMLSPATATGATAMAGGRLRLSPAMATGATAMAATVTAGATATTATAMARGRLRLMPLFSTLAPTTTATLVPSLPTLAIPMLPMVPTPTSPMVLTPMPTATSVVSRPTPTVL